MKENKKLNFGCGKDVKKGYINLDSVNLEGVDIVHNLNEYPWRKFGGSLKRIKKKILSSIR